MPFRECSIVSQREEFCRLALLPGANVQELCRRWGVSSTAAYKWLGRYRLEGAAGLEDRSRRPLTSPGRTDEAMEALVLSIRRDHPTWGGRKIRRVLERDGPGFAPSASTITQILRRWGQLDGPRAGEARDWVRFEHPEPNDLWQMDFKGHFAMRHGRCHPLTVLDDHSRYSLELGACADERDQTVRGRLTLTFRRYGMPWRMLADNGSPWGSTGGEITRLGVWLLDLGIALTHGRPYHPQTQGKDERFHRTLKADVLADRMFEDLAQVQRAFEDWRQVYNHVRPHEALALETPASRYRNSPRTMPDRIEPPQYEPGDIVRKVSKGVWISFRNQRWKCSKALIGRWVVLRPTEHDGLFDLCYRRHVFSQIDLREDKA